MTITWNVHDPYMDPYMTPLQLIAKNMMPLSPPPFSIHPKKVISMTPNLIPIQIMQRQRI